MGTVLKIRCEWCGKSMGEKDGKGATGTTGSICPVCRVKKLMKHAAATGDNRIRFGGYIADLHSAHKTHRANCCDKDILPCDKYYSLVIGGGGVAWLKHPYRSHKDCLPVFMAGLETTK